MPWAYKGNTQVLWNFRKVLGTGTPHSLGTVQVNAVALLQFVVSEVFICVPLTVKRKAEEVVETRHFP